MAQLGAPHDSILLDDLERLDTSPYRLVIFLNAFHLTDRQRALIGRRVLSRNRTVLWCYAAGLFNGSRQDFAMMAELTGLRIEPGPGVERVRARLVLRSAADLLSPVKSGTSLLGQPPRGLIEELGRLPERTIGSPHVWARSIAVSDPDALALGTREGSDAVALALKPQRGWTSVYTLNPVLPAAVLRALARHTGVHLYNEWDDTLWVEPVSIVSRRIRYLGPNKIPIRGKSMIS